LSFFDGTTPFRIDKPIRLIELFGGYGSQALALKYLGVPFEHWKMSEWAVKSIQAYKDLHAADDNTDYSAGLTEAEIKAWLLGRISSNYSEPLNEKQIERLRESEVRKIYNNMKATQNLGSIMAVKGEQLEIVDTDSFCYIMTYSFPCQDLSSAGKGAGMEKGSGTRSGLLWEVERLLTECENLPQVLLMENVPEVVGAKNMPQFAKWLAFLDGLGYKTKWQVLNTKDFGIPQNRARCFAVSVLGDYFYEPPKGFPLNVRLKDFLEKQADESYYLKDETIQALNIHKERHEAKGHGFGWKPTDGGGMRQLLRPKADTDPTATLLLSNQGKVAERFTEVANTLMARDYKGFGNQPMNGVVEWKK
jgi:DNA (cytosine-5)-methyltransferase 1